MNTPSNPSASSFKKSVTPLSGTRTPGSCSEITKINKRFLTPCRRVGLKRKSIISNNSIKSPITSSEEEEKVSSPPDISKPKTTNFCEENAPIILDNNCNNLSRKQKYDVKVKRKIHLTISDAYADNGVGEIQNKTTKPPLDDFNSSVSDSALKFDIQPNDVTIDMLKYLANEIKKKKENLNHKELSSIYAKKHDLKTLKDLSHKWKQGCKEAMYELQAIFKDKGINMTMSAIIDQFQIPYDTIGFNNDTDDFI